MIAIWILRLLIPHYNDMVLNPLTGKASQKNVFQVFYGTCGVVGAGVAIWADVKEHRQVNTSAILFLLLAGLGLAGLKIWQQQANRQTATDAGQPLAAPLPPGEVPPIMPQPFNPNAPENRPLAGYNDHNAPGAPTE